MKIGTKVRKVVPDIEGTVVGARWIEEEAKLSVLVRSDDGHERWFHADELETTGDQE